MKLRILLALPFVLLPLTLHAASPRDTFWKEVAEAAEQGLPKTAIEKLGPIIAGAMQEQAWPEAIKAVAARIGYEGEIECGKPEARITRLEAES